MIDVNYYKYFLNIRNVWFLDQEISLLSNSDITVVHSFTNTVISEFSFCQKTLLTDLTLGKDHLFSLMNYNYRNEIAKSDIYLFNIDVYESSEILANLVIIKTF